MTRSFVRKSSRVDAVNLMDFEDKKTINLSWDKTILNFKEIGDIWLFMPKGRRKEALLYFPDRESYVPLGTNTNNSEDEVIDRIKQYKKKLLTILKSNSDIDYTGEKISLSDGFELKIARRVKSKTYDIEFLKYGEKFYTRYSVFFENTPNDSLAIENFIKHNTHKIYYKNYLADLKELKDNEELDLRNLGKEAIDYINSIDSKIQTRVKKVLSKSVLDDGKSTSNAKWVLNKIEDGWSPKFEEWTHYSKKLDKDIEKAEWRLKKETEEYSYPINKTESDYALFLEKIIQQKAQN